MAAGFSDCSTINMKKTMTLVVKSPSIAASGRNAKPLIWRLWKLLAGGNGGNANVAQVLGQANVSLIR